MVEVLNYLNKHIETVEQPKGFFAGNAHANGQTWARLDELRRLKDLIEKGKL